MTFHVKQALAAGLLAVSLAASAAGQSVNLPGPGIELAGVLHRPDGKGPFPAIVLLHGCGGLWGKDGRPTPSYTFWAEHFRSQGFVALLLDSFGPRGEKEICTQKQRSISEARDRPKDAYSALTWLEGRDDVIHGHVHVMGWSNGGSTTLYAMREGAPGAVANGPRFRSAVAFYPGCATLAKAAYRPMGPTLIQAGGADDWTPAKACEQLARAAQGPGIEIDVYPGAYHAFERIDLPIRVRPDVRNPASASGMGATVGTNPAARAKSIERSTAFVLAHER
jgi:dienelactone hydrolase